VTIRPARDSAALGKQAALPVFEVRATLCATMQHPSFPQAPQSERAPKTVRSGPHATRRRRADGIVNLEAPFHDAIDQILRARAECAIAVSE
jgi:hypothetical protein